jgi:hypothetical protein
MQKEASKGGALGHCIFGSVGHGLNKHGLAVSYLRAIDLWLRFLQARGDLVFNSV